MFRRLAREAVIFALLGMLLAAVGSFIYMHHRGAKAIRAQQEALKKDCDILDGELKLDYLQEVSGGPMTTRAECNSVFGTRLPSFPPPNAPDTLPADFFIKQDAALAEGTRIKNLKVDDGENALVAGVIGLYGFAGGIAIWLFYRLVRFAVKG